MTKHYVDTTSITHLSLCTGYGGIDLGLARVVSNLRTIAYCEREAAVIELLLSRMENGQLDAAPIWTDLRSFPWEAFSDRVDILSGGYPCQPFSAAGKRLGAEDERHLWPAIADGVCILRPRICFFENVEGHISLGLREVIEELEGIGYRTAWGIFSAAEVGAPHQRKRVFVMAVSSSVGGQAGIPRQIAWNERLAGVADNRCSQDLWPSRPGEPQYWWEPPRVVADSRRGERHGRKDCERPIGAAQGEFGEAGSSDSKAEPAMADTRRDQCERRSPVGEVPCEHDGAQGAGEESSGRGQDEAGERTLTESGGIGAEPAVGNANRGGQSSGINARSGVSEDCRREGDVEQAKPREVEPKMGGDVTRTTSGVGYGELCISSDNRTDELRMLGNGVCVPTAARAFVTLMEELNNRHEQNRATIR